MAPHTTFYVPPPLPDAIGPGATLSERDALETRIAIQSRDGLIRMYQKLLVEKEQRLRDFIRTVQDTQGSGSRDYQVIFNSRAWWLMMKLHRLKYRLVSALQKLRLRSH